MTKIDNQKQKTEAIFKKKKKKTQQYSLRERERENTYTNHEEYALLLNND